MKRSLEEVARREPLPRKVKKVVTIGKKPEKKTKPPLFPYWNLLPNEMKAAVVQKMDVATSASFKECGRNESELVRNHARHSVKINLKFTNVYQIERMYITLSSTEDEWSDSLRWTVCKNIYGDTLVEYTIVYPRTEPRMLAIDEKSFEEAVSMILRRLLSEPMFVVNELELQLHNYDQNIDFDSIKANVNLLTLKSCHNSGPVLSILRNKNVNFKAVVGSSYYDRRFLYRIDRSTYGRPRTIPAVSTFPMNEDGSYCSFLFKRGLRGYQKAHERLKNFWDITLGLYDVMNIDAVDSKLKMRKTTDDIMLLRVAYYYDAKKCVPYIQNCAKKYSDRIAFLKDGIDEFLSDYQIIVLSIAYFVRLFRNEPEIRKIHDIAFEDLRVVLKKYENVNLYEKLVAKLEALIPFI